MNRKSPAGKCLLPPAEETRRLELYHAGLSDTRIAAAMGVVPSAIWQWRRYRGLPTQHPKITAPRDSRGRKIRFLLTGGCRMEQAMSPQECEIVRQFFRDLLAYSNKLPPGKKPDIARFMKGWSRLQKDRKIAARERRT